MKVYAVVDTSWGELEMLGIFRTVEQAKEIVADQIKWRELNANISHAQSQRKLNQVNEYLMHPIQFDDGDSIQIFEEEVQ